MNNKKGFTLVELLSTITIMTLVVTIASINIVKIFDNKKEEEEQTTKEVIEEAACVYIELDKNKVLKESCLTNGCFINTNTLIQEGLLNEKDVDKQKVIHIRKENNEKKCIVKED